MYSCSLVLSQHPGLPSLLRTEIDVSAYGKPEPSLQTMCKTIQERLLVLQSMVDANIRKFREQYTLENSLQAHKKPRFTPNAYTFLDNSPQRTSLDSAIEDATTKEHSKILARTFRLFHTISVQDHTIKIDKQ